MYIRKIINYINSDYKDKPIDILMVQNIRDQTALNELLKNIKKNVKAKLYFAPECHDDDSSVSDFLSVTTLLSRGIDRDAIYSRMTNESNAKIKNLIISRYPIHSQITDIINVEGQVDDILGLQCIIGANIIINNKIISVYNCTLSEDVKQAGIVNDDLRVKECEAIFKVINGNINCLQKLQSSPNLLQNLELTDINIIAGNLNISDIINKKLNIEYTNLILNYNLADLYRYRNPDTKGYTNTSKKRADYLLFKITDDLYDEKSPYFKQFHKIRSKMKNDKELFKLIFKRYKVYFVDCYVYKDNYVSNSPESFPVELIFMMHK
jgi:hypothetical protein